ncbi:MAG: HAD-IA family hydrolase [Myxococcales bacterium]|nr:HAD-IA family hydrolase [Myxococcales bacterium]
MRALLFDLDGTLIDSAEDIAISAQRGFEEVGVVGVSREEVRAHLGLSLADLYRALCPDGDAARRERFIQAYRRHYAEHGTEHTSVYPGVEETLRALSHLRLGVATTKLTAVAEQVLAKMGLREHFQHVQGTDGFPPKPHPEVVRRALAALGSPAESAALVGDTDRDVLAARAAGVRAAAVTYGGWSRQRLAALAPDVLLDRFSDLVYWVGSNEGVPGVGGLGAGRGAGGGGAGFSTLMR